MKRVFGDQAPRVTAADLNSGGAAKRFETALINLPQEIRKLAAKAPVARVMGGQSGRPSTYSRSTALFSISPDAGEEEIIHEYFHHIDWTLARPPAQTVSTDFTNPVGWELHLEVNRLGQLGAEGRNALREQIKGNVFLEDLFGSLTFNKVGRGHLIHYFVQNPGSQQREAFADLGTLYAKGYWSRVKAVAPDLAKAFEEWLDLVLTKE